MYRYGIKVYTYSRLIQAYRLKQRDITGIHCIQLIDTNLTGIRQSNIKSFKTILTLNLKMSPFTFNYIYVYIYICTMYRYGIKMYTYSRLIQAYRLKQRDITGIHCIQLIDTNLTGIRH